MKLLVLFAAAGSATSIYTLSDPQALRARNPQLLYRPSNHFSIYPRVVTSHSLRPRGLGTKLATCMGKLCGKNSLPDQSTRGPGYTATRASSAEQSVVQIVPTRSSHSSPQNINPNPQQPHRSSARSPPASLPSSTQSGISNIAPSDELQRQAVASRRGSLDRIWSVQGSVAHAGSGRELTMSRANAPPLIAAWGRRRGYTPVIRAPRANDVTVEEIHLPGRSSGTSSTAHSE